jgi:hypothetical protein
MMLLLYASLNKLRFHLLHNSWLSIIECHYFIEKSRFGLIKEKKRKEVNIVRYYFEMTSIYGYKLKIVNRIQVKAGLSWIKM